MGFFQARQHVDADVDELVDAGFAQGGFEVARLAGEIDAGDAGALEGAGGVDGFNCVALV